MPGLARYMFHKSHVDGIRWLLYLYLRLHGSLSLFVKWGTQSLSSCMTLCCTVSVSCTKGWHPLGPILRKQQELHTAVKTVILSTYLMKAFGCIRPASTNSTVQKISSFPWNQVHDKRPQWYNPRCGDHVNRSGYVWWADWRTEISSCWLDVATFELTAVISDKD